MSDLIEREDAIKALYKYNFVTKEVIEREIMSIPSADRPQGEWIDAEIRHEDGVLPIQVCSECKTFYPLEYTGGGHNFCPNCGSKMRGEHDD